MNIVSSESKELTFAYNVIKDFFGTTDMYHATEDIESLIRSAASNKSYKKRVPGDILFFKDRFDELAAAAFTIYSSYSEREEAILCQPDENQSPDIFKQSDFVPASGHLPPWAAFPRNLSYKQYFNPYKAIKKFVSHMTQPEWKKALKVIVEYALTNDSVDDEYPSYELMVIRLRMLQLIEACHLLHVRTNLKTKILKPLQAKNKK